MKAFVWNEEKNQLLKSARGVSFEEMIAHIMSGDILDIIDNPNQMRYAGQRIFIIKMRDYAWLVPFVESDEEIFLKTIIPSRKATKRYLGDKYGN
jgi:uncharacterized DUF497 family protein